MSVQNLRNGDQDISLTKSLMASGAKGMIGSASAALPGPKSSLKAIVRGSFIFTS